MRHAIIIAHPNPDSLTCAVAAHYVEHVRALGQQAIVRDLYRMGFDPCLKAHEIPGPAGYRVAADILAERQALAEVDVFALVYPFWFNSPPAILKGYVERVFGMGFGYEPGLGGTEPLLEGKRLISFTTSGAPEAWVRDTGALPALMAIFDRHISAMCGLQLVDHVHAGGIVPEMTAEAAGEVLAGVRRALDAHFGALARRDPSELRSST